jgi:hypothetical protein
MVVIPAQQLYFFRSVTLIGRVVDDEDIYSRLVGQRLDEVAYDFGRKERREAHPVNTAGIDETVERVLAVLQGI